MASDRIRRNRDRTIVVLDTSAAMIPFEFLVDFEDELTRILGKYKIIIPSSVYEEIIYLSKEGKGRKKRFAIPTVDFVKKYDIFETSCKADDSVLKVADELNGYVFTNDKELRRRAKEKNLKTIYLRSKKRLEIN